MAERRTRFMMVMEYFRTADLVEARAALQAATEGIELRESEPERPRRSRKEKPAAEQAAAATTNG